MTGIAAVCPALYPTLTTIGRDLRETDTPQTFPCTRQPGTSHVTSGISEGTHIPGMPYGTASPGRPHTAQTGASSILLSFFFPPHSCGCNTRGSDPITAALTYHPWKGQEREG